MRILFSTIVLDGLPYLTHIYEELRKLPKEIEWRWWIMEGTTLPVHCTRWVSCQEPRLSQDGTTQYLWSISQADQRVNHICKYSWMGKIAMVNEPLVGWTLPGVWHLPKEDYLLWQIDSDEIWLAEQIVRMRQMFLDQPEKNAAFFWCRYFVGPDKVITTRNCFGNQSNYEWHRVWKIRPGMLFQTHEPPVIAGLKLNPFTHAETEANGLVFDHFSYATRAQVEYKEKFYAGPNNPNAPAYNGLTERWERFQEQTEWPRSLKEMMPWAEEGCMVDKV